jgi:homeobox protein cut-like
MPQLDSTAAEIVAQQRDALLERKELAQKTKDFRKLEDAAKLTEYKTLLKGKMTVSCPTLEANHMQRISHSLI